MRKGWIVFWIFFVLAVLASFYFDNEIVQSIEKIRNVFFDNALFGITFLSAEIIIFFTLTVIMLWREHKRRWILPLWTSLILTAIVSFILKIFIQRPRPYQFELVSALPIFQIVSHNIWDFSFPSFQTMLAFCALPIICKEFPRFKYVWIFFALLVGFSRVYFGVHFMSDVLLGGMIGYFIGFLIIQKEDENNFWKGIYEGAKKKLRLKSY